MDSIVTHQPARCRRRDDQGQGKQEGMEETQHQTLDTEAAPIPPEAVIAELVEKVAFFETRDIESKGVIRDLLDELGRHRSRYNALGRDYQTLEKHSKELQCAIDGRNSLFLYRAILLMDRIGRRTERGLSRFIAALEGLKRVLLPQIIPADVRPTPQPASDFSVHQLTKAARFSSAETALRGMSDDEYRRIRGDVGRGGWNNDGLAFSAPEVSA